MVDVNYNLNDNPEVLREIYERLCTGVSESETCILDGVMMRVEVAPIKVIDHHDNNKDVLCIYLTKASCPQGYSSKHNLQYKDVIQHVRGEDTYAVRPIDDMINILKEGSYTIS